MSTEAEHGMDIVTDELINRFSIGQLLDAVLSYGYGSGEEFFEWLTNNWTDEDDAQTIIDQLHEALQRYHEPIEMPEPPDYPPVPPVVEALQDAVFTALAPEPPHPISQWPYEIRLVRGPQLWEHVHDQLRHMQGKPTEMVPGVGPETLIAVMQIPTEGLALGRFKTEYPPIGVVAHMLSNIHPGDWICLDHYVGKAYWHNLIRFTAEEV